MDTWERRAIGYGPGFNNPPGGVNFMVVYDPDTDTLTITADAPVFGPVDTINFQTDLGASTLSGYTIDSPTVITQTFAANALGGVTPVELQQLDFFSPGPTLVGTWTGSVIVDPTPVVPQIGAASYVDYYNSDDPGAGLFSCAGISTAAAEAGAFFYVDNPDPSIAGVQLDGIAPNGDPWSVNFTTSFNPSFFKYGGTDPTAGYFIIADNFLKGFTVQQATALNASAVPLGPAINLDMFWPDVVSAGIASTGPDDFAVYFNPDNQPPYAADRVDVRDCSPSGLVTYYNPAGPNAGLNPGTFTSVQWDTEAILFTDTALPVDINVVEVVFSSALPAGNWVEYGDPIPAADPPAPNITSFVSTAPGQFRIEGTYLSGVNILDLRDGGDVYLGNSYADPLGPNSGVNPGSATIVQWDDDALEVLDAVNLSGFEVGSVESFDLGPTTIQVFEVNPEVTIA